MKKIKSNKKGENVTKSYLDEQLNKMIKTIDKRFDRLFVYLDYRFEPLEKMAEDYPKFKDYVYDKLDWLVGKYQKLDDEHTVPN